MSYRTFKHMLGETSLERKCRFLFGACLLLLITGSFWLYGQRTERLVYQQSAAEGRLAVSVMIRDTHWEYLETSEDFKTTTLQALLDDLQVNDYAYEFISANSVNKDFSPQNSYDERILDRFKDTHIPEAEKPTDGTDLSSDAQPHEVPYVLRQDLPGELQYFQPVYAQQSCIQCHEAVIGTGPIDSTSVAFVPSGDGNTMVQAEGDLLAVVKVRIPKGPTIAKLHKNRAILLATAIVTVCLAMVAAWVIVRYVIVKPLKHLHDVSVAISRGDIQQRAEIHTGDEFEQLGIAFNRMLRHLVRMQEDLRQVNGDLDGKVDQLAQANMQLFEMNRLKSDFLATMSHELRTPLNSIIGFSDVLESIQSLDDKQRRYVHNIQRSGRMLLDMINDILDLAKIESGKMDVRLTEFRIEHVVIAQCDLARPLAEKKNLDLDIRVDSNLPELRQDQAKVQQVLNNLLSNAIKFTPEGGRITVSAHRDNAGRLEMIVADTGVGIAEDEQARIFEKFRQGTTVAPSGDAMTREYSGTGLGLSIVKELCRLLEGEISLDSQLGRGSAFAVHLPWTLTQRPQLESPLALGLEDLTKPLRHDYRALAASPPPDDASDSSASASSASTSRAPASESSAAVDSSA
jgi:signal transduction histidine kinase